MARPIVALLSDFGAADGYVGAMKGVVLSALPDAQLIDVAHEIPPGDVLAAAWTLATAWETFPDGTVFLCVVDPEVGSARRGLAVAVAGARFVCRDNGLLTLVLAGRAFEAVALSRVERWRPSPSSVFHGRDVFAPVAAGLAGGLSLDDVGDRIDDLERLPLATAARDASGLVRGHVIHLDRFGNVITDISSALLPVAPYEVRIAGRSVTAVVDHYAAGAQGRLLALVNSAGHLEIALRGGSAARRIGADRGAPVEVRPLGPKGRPGYGRRSPSTTGT